jgi:flagellar biosynthesis protein FliQ
VSVTDAITWLLSALAAGVVVGLIAALTEIRR